MRNALPALALASLVAIAMPVAAPAQVAATPAVQSFSPASIVAGSLTIGHPLTVVIIGTGFRPGMTATVSSATITPRQMPITVDSATHATLTLRVPVLETAGKLTIVLANPPPGSSVAIVFTLTAPGTATPSPSPTPFGPPPPVGLQFNLGSGSPSATPSPQRPAALPLVAQNGVPVVTSISPTSVAAGGSVSVALSGNNFNGTSIVLVGGYKAAPASVTSTSLTVVIPAGVLTPGSVPVTVFNPAPGGGTSAALTFTVTQAANPPPAVSSVTPATIVAGSGATTVSVAGTGFAASTSSALGGTSGAVSGNTIVFNLPASLLASAGILSGIITNPAPGGGGASFSIAILNGPPAVTAFAPTSANAGVPGLNVNVSGSNFRNGSVVTIAGTPVPTTFVSATQLVGALSAAMLQRPGTLSVGVTTPAPGGGSAAGPGGFAVLGAVPAISALNPAAVSAGSTGFTFIVTGTGFNGTSTAFVRGGLTAAASTQLATVFTSGTALTVTIPATLLPLATTLSVYVVNAPPGGGTSSSLNLVVNNPTPVVAGVNPTAPSPAGGSATLTVTGTRFVQGATVSVGGTALATTFVSATQLTAVLPAPYPAGNLTVTVTNPAPGGGVSNGFSIQLAVQ